MESGPMAKLFFIVLSLLIVNIQAFGGVIFVSDRHQFYNPEFLSPSQIKRRVLPKAPFKVDPLSQEY